MRNYLLSLFACLAVVATSVSAATHDVAAYVWPAYHPAPARFVAPQISCSVCSQADLDHAVETLNMCYELKPVKGLVCHPAPGFSGTLRNLRLPDGSVRDITVP